MVEKHQITNNMVTVLYVLEKIDTKSFWDKHFKNDYIKVDKIVYDINTCKDGNTKYIALSLWL